MEIIKYPSQDNWEAITTRPTIDNTALLGKVTDILNEVQTNGDKAVAHYTKQFDGVAINNFLVTEQEFADAQQQVPAALQKAIKQAADNIFRFHIQQVAATEVIETMPGITCWRKSVGIQKVGLYIPGGTAPLFSTLLMLGIPAKIADCKEIIVCTPANKDGIVAPAILYAASVVGIKKLYKIGGVQAIAAMAFGTETVPKVYKIFGPGNQYVTAAKQLVQQAGIAIDMPAGPSEVCILADDTANANFVAADLLSQAEHGVDSQAMLVTTSEHLLAAVQAAVAAQLQQLPRKDIAEKALANSKLVLVKNMQEAIDLVNEYAAEHLIISTENYMDVANEIVNAGSIFLGNYSPESVGDYASGTNHTLPTNGFAKAYSGVSVDSFVKKITYQQLSEDGLRNIADTVTEMATAEGLQAHANAVSIRL